MVEQSRKPIIGTPPERKMRAVRDGFDLVQQRRSILSLVERRCASYFASSVVLDLSDFRLHAGEFVTVAPYLAPISLAQARRNARADGVQHPFRGIRIGWTVGAVHVKIAQKDMCVFADVAEVDGLAALL